MLSWAYNSFAKTLYKTTTPANTATSSPSQSNPQKTVQQSPVTTTKQPPKVEIQIQTQENENGWDDFDIDEPKTNTPNTTNTTKDTQPTTPVSTQGWDEDFGDDEVWDSTDTETPKEEEKKQSKKKIDDDWSFQSKPPKESKNWTKERKRGSQREEIKII